MYLLGLERCGNTSNIHKFLLLHELSKILSGVHDRRATTDAHDKSTLDVLVYRLTCSLQQYSKKGMVSERIQSQGDRVQTVRLDCSMELSIFSDCVDEFATFYRDCNTG